MKSSMFVAKGAAMLAGTMLSGVPVMAQTAPAPASAPQPVVAPAPAAGQSATPEPVRTIKTMRVEGSQRIEPEKVLS